LKTTAIDSNIAIYLLNGKEDVFKKLEDYQTLYIPITVVGELLYGALNSAKPDINIQKYKLFFASCITLDINNIVAEHYSYIRKELKNIGKPIPENDIWIAATCLAYEVSFITSDKHFSYIKDLDLTII
jgi:tRNA(fMet)-specific endonuclease VapC